MYKEVPEVGDLVVVTIREVQNFGAIAQLDEYPGYSGFIHIAEVATGWIRHIRDFVRVNQRTVCKVLNVDANRKHVDLSLKRVNAHQKREKIEEWKNDQKAYKLLGMIMSEAKISNKSKIREIENYLITEYGSIYNALYDAAADKDFMIDIKEPWRDMFIKIAGDNISIPLIKIGGVIEMYSIAPDGIDSIKEVLEEVSEDKNINISYMGAPKYRISIMDEDYKSAEEKLKKNLDLVADKCKKRDVEYSFSRDE